jgi:hypothetical protein
MNRHLYIVNIFGKFIKNPFVFAVQFREIEFTDRMAVENGFVFIDHRIMAVDPHRTVIVRD